jgi:hypothetical protein
MQEPYKLPAGFEWTNVNFKNEDDLDQVCTTEICFYNLGLGNFSFLFDIFLICFTP